MTDTEIEFLDKLLEQIMGYACGEHKRIVATINNRKKVLKKEYSAIKALGEALEIEKIVEEKSMQREKLREEIVDLTNMQGEILSKLSRVENISFGRKAGYIDDKEQAKLLRLVEQEKRRKP